MIYMKSHVHIPATYLKYFSVDQSKGRSSIVKVHNIKSKEIKNLTVNNIGKEKNIFIDTLERFNSSFENHYDQFIDLVISKDPIDKTDERLKGGFMILFNFLIRNRFILNKIKELHNQNSILKKELGNDPLKIPNYIEHLYWNLILRRPYPISIRIFPEHKFITSDNPITKLRFLPFGTLYFLPLDRKRLFCLGYYPDEFYLKEIEERVYNYPIKPQNINIKIKKNAKTFVIL